MYYKRSLTLLILISLTIANILITIEDRNKSIKTTSNNKSLLLMN